MTAVLVVVGAAFGAPLRFIVDRWVTGRTAGVSVVRELPWGLVVVNVAGSAIAGLVAAGTEGPLRVLLLTGFCGAFTTFSGFAWESVRLWSIRRADFWLAVVAMPLAAAGAFVLADRIAGILLG